MSQTSGQVLNRIPVAIVFETPSRVSMWCLPLGAVREDGRIVFEPAYDATRAVGRSRCYILYGVEEG
jgi:hypothetical protein